GPRPILGWARTGALSLRSSAVDRTKDAVASPLPQGDRPSAVVMPRQVDTRGRSLRVHAARGVLVNTAFDVGLSALGVLRGFILAAIISRSDYGIWGILAI